MKREGDIVTAAGIVKDVGGLISAAGFAAAVRRAQRRYAVVISVEKFPVKLGSQRTSAASNSRGSKESGKLAADFILLAQQTIHFITRTNRRTGVIIRRFCRHSAGHKAFRSCSQHICPERHDCCRYNASASSSSRGRKPLCLFLADLEI